MKIEFDGFDRFFSGKNPLVSKTVLLNAATAVAEVLTAPQLGELVPAEYRGHIAFAAAVGNIWLRSKGSAPLDWGKAVETLTPFLKKK